MATATDTSKKLRILLGGVELLFLIGFVLFAAGRVSDPPPDDLRARVAANARERGEVPVQLAQIAPVIRNAVIASEDERFNSHHGIDSIGTARKLVLDVAEPGWREGATITEQLAKHLYLHGGPGYPWHDSLWHQLQEITLALEIDKAAIRNPRFSMPT